MPVKYVSNAPTPKHGRFHPQIHVQRAQQPDSVFSIKFTKNLISWQWFFSKIVEKRIYLTKIVFQSTRMKMFCLENNHSFCLYIDRFFRKEPQLVMSFDYGSFHKSVFFQSLFSPCLEELDLKWNLLQDKVLLSNSLICEYGPFLIISSITIQ